MRRVLASGRRLESRWKVEEALTQGERERETGRESPWQGGSECQVKSHRGRGGWSSRLERLGRIQRPGRAIRMESPEWDTEGAQSGRVTGLRRESAGAHPAKGEGGQGGGHEP